MQELLKKSAMAQYQAIKDKKVSAVINIGHETTNVSIFNKGILMNTETIQIGGNNIDNDIECIFGVNVFDARKIKEKFSSSHKRQRALRLVHCTASLDWI